MKTVKQSDPDALALVQSRVVVQRKEPLWKGPQDSSNLGGITSSAMQRFLVCRERFRVTMLEGLRPYEQFDQKIEYGNLWHACEEAHAKGISWEESLREEGKKLAVKYPDEFDQVDKWYRTCEVAFPVYVDYWKKHPDVKKRIPLFEEKVFQLPYKLPSGKVVYLRGKFDSVDRVEGSSYSLNGIYLQENKTKGDIDRYKIERNLTFDLQTMFYLTALKEYFQTSDGAKQIPKGSKLMGVRYNVVKRPLSGGKGNIRQHKATKNKREESKEEFFDRLQQVIKENAEEFFVRWMVLISNKDMEQFKNTCLNPILESMCVWYDHVTKHADPYGIHHWVFPFGVYHVLAEGGSTDLDEYIATGSKVGLHQVNSLFNELQ